MPSTKLAGNNRPGMRPAILFEKNRLGESHIVHPPPAFRVRSKTHIEIPEYKVAAIGLSGRG